MNHADEAVLDRFRAAWRCEVCKRPTPSGCDPAHIFSRGAGRVDIPANIVALCRWCHGRAHDGHISRAKLLAIAARRERTTPQAIEDEVYRIRRLPKGSTL